MKTLIWITGCLIAFTVLVCEAGEQNSIELDDGSRIYGEVVDFEGGHYLIESPTLGRLRIDADRIRTIRPNRGSASEPLPGGADASRSTQMLDIQQQLVTTPQIMSMITDLQNDPQLRSILADPRLMRAISAGDLNTLREDPSFRALFSHPGIREIIEQVR